MVGIGELESFGFWSLAQFRKPRILSDLTSTTTLWLAGDQREHRSYTQSMLILGIETSCDETGLALLDSEQGLLAQQLYSQVDMHVAYGGVVPELASRDHIRRVLPLLDRVL